MRISLLTVILSFVSLAASAAEIASINFESIKDDLRAYYLSKPENAELKKEYEVFQKEERKQMEEMQKKVLENSKSIDLSSIMPMAAVSHYELDRKIDANLKKELYVLVSGLGLKYELIYDSSNSDALIYSKTQIDDVTPAVKQAIIDLQKKK